MKNRPAGFSLLELMVVAALLAVLAGLLLNRLHYYQEAAEKMNMETTVGTLRSALLLKIAEYMTAGKSIEYEQIAQENPIDWLEIKPPNYAGAFSGPPPDTMPRGSWYFNSTGRTLVYQVNNGRYFMPDSHGEKQARFRLVLIRGVIQGREALGDFPMPASGVKLEAVEPYRWELP
ncbi:MAG: prepilin-type N-terminal cleavage/methylation domain-containing protein [Sulfuricella denitrificans]|nr:prepilin-type N-terminal cleavage/methylation domain-containing protein [Sulfuricella denitrificans]